jgi:tagatose-1,6-bisphosphate aldolase
MEGLREEMERCREWIEAALEHGGGTHDFDDICEAVSSGYMQFWPADDACAVTEVITYPKKKVLHIFLAGGNKDTILDMNESAIEFAKQLGCDGMTICGRAGWARELKSHGWKEQYRSLVRDI